MSGMTKAERLAEIKRLYIQRAYSDIELAQRLGVARETVYRDRIELTTEYPVEADENGRYYIPRSKMLSEIKVSLHEALALYLAGRKASRQTRYRQHHAINAVEKLAATLRQPMTERLLKSAEQMMQQEQNPEKIRIIETITQAWVEQRKVRVEYQALGNEGLTRHTLNPYLIEPSIWSDSVYVIARSDFNDKILPFKIERILSAILSGETFEIPDTFDEQELLRSAWGIWYGDKKPERVKLRFSHDVTRRVKESIWHPLEQVEDTEDGGCIWSVEIAEWREMLPWVRGWGADVEVLEPEGLRTTLEKEAKNMADLYQVPGTMQMPLYQILWAKTTDDKTATHPLICHMIDVSMCAWVLWEDALSKGARLHLASFLGMESTLDDAGCILSFWAGLHDIGKASPCFQMKHQPTRLMEEKGGLTFSRLDGREKCLHGHISTRVLQPLLERETGLPKTWAGKVALALGGHHGEWPTHLGDFANDTLAGKQNWDKVRRAIFLHLKEIVAPPVFSPPELLTVESNTFFTLLSGFVSVADWLGSMEDYFQPQQGFIDLEKYTEHAKKQARKALQENGWLGWKPPSSPISITELCAIPAARPLQAAVIDLANKLERPELVLIEAPTGEGKTEAAVYLADTWGQTLQQRGAYIAMPTMATSNQMYERITKMLKRRYQDESFLSFHLLHGNAALQENNEVPALSKIDEKSGNIGAASWFTKRKRGLLAPFAVGTVDQALLSALQTPHFFVRLFGLSGKTVIFDEVHAYDTYMDELFFHLLRWLKAIGASVVILSATLPEATRRNILQAYTDKPMENLPAAPYPSITWTNGKNLPEVIDFSASSPRTLQIEKIDQDPQKIANILEKELENGGYAAVICNTVDRAQKIYRTLLQQNFVPPEDLYLFHARFPFEWRQKLENTVTNVFDNRAPENEPRSRKIVVATQVIEQSLDLDFDLMVSDLAPIDLLLQRAGRLHRSPKRQNRPKHLLHPRLLVAIPELESDIPKFSRGDIYVYERYILLRTYLALTERIEIPKDTRILLESVYGSEEHLSEQFPHVIQQALQESLETMKKIQQENWRMARQKLILPPDNSDLLTTPITRLDEENPELHSFMRAATRLALPSIALICVHKTSDGCLALDPEPGSALINLGTVPDFAQTRLLMARKVEVTNYELVKYFSEQQTPKGWAKSPWLRYARCVEFEKKEGLEGSVFQVPGKPWKLILDRKLGLVFNKGA
jgi:CRISPR-associated endonuclease/helicase Cas3